MFVERVRQLLKEKGIFAKDMLSELGINKNQLTRWEKEGTLPNRAILIAIADFLDTTPEYLIGETDVKERSPEEHTEEISPDELALIKSYRRNTEEIKKAARAVLGVGEDDYEPDYKLVAFGGDKRVNKTIKPKLT